MTTPEVVRCPDGHFHRAVYGLSPYITDYPEQVWLASIVQGWCPKYVSDSCCFNPFTHRFPRADIHELLMPDLLHQVIKGTFKDHIIMWINQYLVEEYGEARAHEIIADIDHRYSILALQSPI
ncbi:hypothetical protein BJV74DRAFT_784509 [Russula compacta]|nr:hypothetical protein BJV74DRAFT_784509 [Russula compacta]